MNTTRQQTTLNSSQAFSRMQTRILQRKCACSNHTTAGGECAECGKKRMGLQRKLTIGASNDPLELEADRISDQVMAMPAHIAVTGAPPRIQRFAEQTTGDAGTVPASVDRVLASSGKPLEPALRQDMEQCFGHDFSHVRVHTGGAAEQSAQDVNAHAYTVGYSVVFGAGRFAPETHEGRRLIAHELTHVVQQHGTSERTCGQPQLDRSMSKVILQRYEEAPTSCDDDREPNSDTVANIIINAYHGTRSRTYSVDELFEAWSHVRNKRELPGGANCCSPELAAAEHYLYARYAVANRDWSPFEMKALIWGYGNFKKINEKLKKLYDFVPRTGICPPSPDTQGSRDWSYRGVDDGVTDLFHQELAQNNNGGIEGNQPA